MLFAPFLFLLAFWQFNEACPERGSMGETWERLRESLNVSKRVCEFYFFQMWIKYERDDDIICLAVFTSLSARESSFD